MKLPKLITLLVAIVTLTVTTMNKAEAALLIEPHLSYNLHSSGDNPGEEYSYNGPQMGLKLGYQTFGFMFGLDYKRSTYTLETEYAGGGKDKDDVKRNEIGVFAGYNFPILVRAWVGHYFSNKAEAKDGSGEMEGKTTELGVGFTGLPFLSVNFIYRMVSYDEGKAGGQSYPISPKMDSNEFVIGISLPLTL